MRTRLRSALLPMLLVTACATEEPAAPELLAAPGGGGSGGPKVSSADPSNGNQGQSLTVRVLGSGFDQTAVASWERNGQPDPKITVTSTTFISSKEVRANITIAADADTVLYDVAVTLFVGGVPGKKGVGIEKFSVKPGPHPANSTVMLSDALFTIGSQPVRGSEGDSLITLTVGTDDEAIDVGLYYQLTHATYQNAVRLGQPPCAYDPADKPGTIDDDRRARLFDKLIENQVRGRFALWITVSKPNLEAASDNHGWSLHWYQNDSLFTVSENFGMIPGVFPTVEEISSQVYRFSGGRVGIRDRNGSPGRDYLHIACPNLDSFTVTWNPPAP